MLELRQPRQFTWKKEVNIRSRIWYKVFWLGKEEKNSVCGVVDWWFMETYEKQQCIDNFHVMKTMYSDYIET